MLMLLLYYYCCRCKMVDAVIDVFDVLDVDVGSVVVIFAVLAKT